jgi:polar amino acid transport system substrate-binding protein
MLTRTTLARFAAALLPALLIAGCSAEGSETEVGFGPRLEVDQELHEMLPDAVRERGTLRVGTDASYAPMSSYGDDGRTIVGLEPDLGKALGQVLGVKVVFTPVDFTAIIAGVQAGTLDLGMSAMTDTEERAEQVDFVNYFSAGTSILVQRGNPAGITEINDLCGKVVAVEKGTTQVDLLERSQVNCSQDKIDIRTYSTNSDALVQLRTGRAAAVLNDLPPAALLVTDPTTKAHYQLASTNQYEPGLYGVAVDKQEPGLRDAVQGAFETLLEEGVYADVLAEWGVEDGAVKNTTVNSGR